MHQELISGVASKCRALLWLLAMLVLGVATLGGCARDQIHSSSQHNNISLQAGELKKNGLAFITPSTVTGKEADTQALALIFSEVLESDRPDVESMPLSETLSAVNKAGLSDQYKKMYVDYRDTGIFERDVLRKVSEVTGVRYLAQLKLSSFAQNSRSRFSLLGLRLFQTKQANIRIFLQVWDGSDGTIVWEGSEEVNFAYDTGYEIPITFKTMIEEAARNLISGLPNTLDEK